MALYTTTLAGPSGSNDRPPPAHTAASPFSDSINLWGTHLRTLFTVDGDGPTLVTGGFDWTTTDWTDHFPNGSDPPPKVGGTLLLGTDVFGFSDALQAGQPITLTVTYYIIEVDGGGYKFYFTIKPSSSVFGVGSPGDLPITSTTSHKASAYNGYSGAECFSSTDGTSFVLVMGATFSDTPSCGLGTFYIDRTRDSSGTADGRGAICGYAGSYSTTVDPGVTGVNGNHKRGHTYVMDFESGGIATQGGTGPLEGLYASGFLPGDLCNVVVPHAVVGLDQQLSPSFNVLMTFDAVGIADQPVISGGGTYYCLGAFCVVSEPPPGLPPATLVVAYE